MEELTSPTRRTLLTAAAASLATPVIAAAQPAELRQEGGKFNLWVISDCHVGTDKAASESRARSTFGSAATRTAILTMCSTAAPMSSRSGAPPSSIAHSYPNSTPT